MHSVTCARRAAMPDPVEPRTRGRAPDNRAPESRSLGAARGRATAGGPTGCNAGRTLPPPNDPAPASQAARQRRRARTLSTLLHVAENATRTADRAFPMNRRPARATLGPAYREAPRQTETTDLPGQLWRPRTAIPLAMTQVRILDHYGLAAAGLG